MRKIKKVPKIIISIFSGISLIGLISGIGVYLKNNHIHQKTIELSKNDPVIENISITKIESQLKSFLTVKDKQSALLFDLYYQTFKNTNNHQIKSIIIDHVKNYLQSYFNYLTILNNNNPLVINIFVQHEYYVNITNIVNEWINAIIRSNWVNEPFLFLKSLPSTIFESYSFLEGIKLYINKKEFYDEHLEWWSKQNNEDLGVYENLLLMNKDTKGIEFYLTIVLYEKELEELKKNRIK